MRILTDATAEVSPVVSKTGQHTRRNTSPAAPRLDCVGLLAGCGNTAIFSSVALMAGGNDAMQGVLNWLGRGLPRNVAGVEAY